MPSSTENTNVMKQNEHYNLNSTPQLTAVQKSLPFIQKAVKEYQTTSSSTTPSPFTIVDYGCSQGGNSLIAIQEILSALRQKYDGGGDGSFPDDFLIVFNDLPTNDWNTLIKTVVKESLPNRRCFTLASGRSFYEQILPLNTVDFGYTSTAIHWLSKKPCNLSNQCFSCSVTDNKPEEFQLWKEQACEDYRLFLQQRSKELKKGAILLCSGLARDDDNGRCHAFIYENLYQSAAIVLDKDELLNFNIVDYHRTLDELTNPETLKETNFELILAEIVKLEQPLFVGYKQGILNVDELANKFTEFIRSWSESSLKNALRSDDRVTIIDQVYNEVERRMKTHESLKEVEENINRTYSYVILRKM
ncbi:unnamed protein product [Didymodactylos carnosus]|uniref:Uncharacterized protein n=1 Tax=Didymodactylos carnosus TaxID=1234261 RepID=A0A814ESQ0_9BILA|nr:unnamed protein product [Didymodactylos carnosus]CAF0973507.1 unnamed protein product [Didymodactylos carnosus]CAF3566051.1 unnamed protein product [Didymodactylos carnosus]CAF3746419.1 unnamed protein product [Didymodactylos carnosus]